MSSHDSGFGPIRTADTRCGYSSAQLLRHVETTSRFELSSELFQDLGDRERDIAEGEGADR
jgi:hypothetical protein